MPDPGKKFVGEIDRISGSGNGIIQPDGCSSTHINLGNVPKEMVGEVVIAEMDEGNRAQVEKKVDSTSIAKELRNASVVLTDSKMTLSTSEKEISESEDYPEVDDDAGRNPISKNELENSVNSGEKTKRIEELREVAEANSTESVSEEAKSTTTQTQQYDRSPEVRRYVKKRADGLCEGCGESAPFISKTDEPYLHAHHIYELSDGGSDTPETVIALCPNCHYRVHHGKDGKEYNQELLKKVQKIESK